MLKAALFRSVERFDAFRRKLGEYGVQVTVLDFDSVEWIDFDFRSVDFALYYPSFEYGSPHPLSLYKVHDNLMHLRRHFPDLKLYPDPNVIPFYNDKYRQYLFLKQNAYPIADTYPLVSEEAADRAEREFGYPMVVKNRYGAGGGSVFRVENRQELDTYHRLSKMDHWHWGAARHLGTMASRRLFYYNLIKARKMSYPFLSPPLLAQRYVTHDCDLKTVVGGGAVVEAHWRRKAHGKMWKVNIDDGGIGEWSFVPEEALEVSVRLARDLNATWVNLDLMLSEGRFLVSEFSPVWHHYAYKEKPSFVYKDDYNIDVPLHHSLDLEEIIVKSLVESCNAQRVGT